VLGQPPHSQQARAQVLCSWRDVNSVGIRQHAPCMICTEVGGEGGGGDQLALHNQQRLVWLVDSTPCMHVAALPTSQTVSMLMAWRCCCNASCFPICGNTCGRCGLRVAAHDAAQVQHQLCFEVAGCLFITGTGCTSCIRMTMFLAGTVRVGCLHDTVKFV
jgi:hypothetical protein